MYLDQMKPFVITNAAYTAPTGFVIKAVVESNFSTGTLKGKRYLSDGGNDFAVGGDYANAALAIGPNQMVPGPFSEVTVTGTVVVYIVHEDAYGAVL